MTRYSLIKIRGFELNCKIIAIEGIDGSGKNLQVDMLYERLALLGKKCEKLSFPKYDGFFGKEIGTMLKGDDSINAESIKGKSMALWYALDRWEVFKQVDLTKLDVLLLNRYTLSNVIYQGIEANEDFEQWVFDLEHNILGLPQPDIYIILDVNQEMSKINVAKKGFREYVGSEPDIYEKKCDFMAKVRGKYIH